MALHLRGNTEAFMRAATPHKSSASIPSARTCIPSIPTKGATIRSALLPDYWLKGTDNGVMDEPPVKLAIRKGGDAFEWRDEHE